MIFIKRARRSFALLFGALIFSTTIHAATSGAAPSGNTKNSQCT